MAQAKWVKPGVFVSTSRHTSVFKDAARPMKRPDFPMNRSLKEGEMPCLVCGSGREDHSLRNHIYGPRGSLWASLKRRALALKRGKR